MTSQEVFRRAALCAAVGPVLFTLTWVILGLISPGFTLFGTVFEPYSPMSHPISGLGLGPTASFMNAAFVLMGLLLIIGVVGIFQGIGELSARARWSCILLLALSGVGAVLDGIFTLESFLLHFVGFGLGCVTPIVSFLVTGLVLRQVPRWRRLGSWLLVASPTTLMLLVLSFMTFDQADAMAGRGVAGLTERALIVEIHLWFVALGWQAFRHATTRSVAAVARSSRQWLTAA